LRSGAFAGSRRNRLSRGSGCATARDARPTAGKEFLFLKARLEEILSERTGQSIERIREDTDRDFWMSAKEALAYGLIDHVDE
jgi:ATP-dependent Clp protease protease subunit